jgi:sRNA-binding regulator protein Hfq
MKTIIENTSNTNHGKLAAGVIILIAGGLLLADNLHLFFVPDWLFSWPMWLIAWGVYMGGKYNFRKPIWAIMIFLGIGFLLSENIENADRIVWPVAIIGTGLWMVFKHQISRLNALYHEKQV